MSDYVEVEYDRVVRDSGKAVLVEIDGDEYWLPWSCIEDNGDLDPDGGSLYLAEWKAKADDIPYC